MSEAASSLQQNYTTDVETPFQLRQTTWLVYHSTAEYAGILASVCHPGEVRTLNHVAESHAELSEPTETPSFHRTDRPPTPI